MEELARQLRVARGERDDQGGTVYVTVGAGGNDEGLVNAWEDRSGASDW